VIWATRPRCHVDRTACAWLIRRFVDADATFVFAEDIDDVPDGATPFDMRGAAFSHRDGDCSFERFLAEYGLHDPVLARLGEIVHEADVGDGRFEAPEAAGLNLAIRALAHGRDDPELLAVALDFYDGLYGALTAAVPR
jgi:hypothetical protein